ncbi:S-locus-specific glycoprotein S6 precursor, putative [Ricinus communis]|uniref:non-specific serine/threonine protein kinase n=1 Tax=Ricinus communis TaxID=3988 RepID=B9SSB7_RICCO|nr:S-locus-specific glycoprotein S6 precursor, putative [Ricinus communis]
MKGFELLSCCSVLFCFFAVSFSADSISVNQTIKDGQTIVSASGRFELGFFSPSDSTSRYVGIWYPFSNTTIVWLANREMPLNDSSGVLQLTSKGILVLHNSSNTTFWLTNISTEAKSPVAQLLDSGNLVVREADDTNEDNYLWQSFDYLTDTFLPGLKFGKNLVTGHERTLVSWKSKNDPSIGDATIRLDPDGYPQIYIRVSEVIIFRSGPWNGLRFSGMPNLKPNPIYTYEFVYNDKEIYYRYDLISTSVVSMMVINDEGIFQRLTWSNSTQTWSLYLTAQMDNCDRYGICGAYGSCNINNSPACACLNGFVPRNEPAWDSGDWTGGCVRKNESICGAGEGFYKISGVKLPDTRNSWYNRTMDIRECERICLKNCSCTAYSTLNITDGSGCLLWFEELIDIREYNENGQDFFIRLSASDLVSIVVRQERDLTDESREKDLELPIFDFLTIANATDMFSGYNKLGEGGFGPVYKGTLKDGREIAVKRLSKDSTQGLDEFKNEVIFIAKLQHRNLVKLLGCCIEQAETMLIYEYMPNKSLDAFIFGMETLSGRKSPDDRPTMSTVVLMLTSDISLPQPKEPGFFTERKVFEQDSSSSKVDTCSANEITITLLDAR